MGILISHLLCDLSGRLVRLAQEFFRSVNTFAGNILYKRLLHILAENCCLNSWHSYLPHPLLHSGKWSLIVILINIIQHFPHGAVALRLILLIPDINGTLKNVHTIPCHL